MKLVAIFAVALVSLLAIAYTVTFILVRAQVEQYPDNIEFAMLIRGASDRTETIGERLSLRIEKDAEYGWLCVRKTTNADPSWQESLTIPSRPASWEHLHLVSVSADGRTAYSSGQGEIAPTRTFFEMVERLCFVKTVYWHNTWSVVEGDPPGDYVFTVTFDGKTVTRTINITTEGAVLPLER